MTSLVEELSQYAAYHRDRRNIVTHFIGIPIIVASVCILLSRPALMNEAAWLTPGTVAAAMATLYYLRLDVRYAAVLAAYLAACLRAATALDSLATGPWLAVGLGLFTLGWVIQFVGHYYEGRKPAFVDDMIGLMIGPLFVTAEAGFLLGMRKDIEDAITARAGQIR